MFEYDQPPPGNKAQDMLLLVQSQRTEKLSSFLKWAGGKEQELKYIQPLIPSFESYYEPFVGGGAVFFSIQSAKKFINDKSEELVNLYRRVAQQDELFFSALEALLCGWQRVSQIVDESAAELITLYKAYSADGCSRDDIDAGLFAFLSCYAAEFTGMFEGLLKRDGENVVRELQRNLLGKTRRMKRLEGKKRKLPERDIVANIESALKSGFYMHVRYLYNRISSYDIPAGLAAALFFFVRENAYASMFRYNRRGEFNVPYGGITYNRKDLARKVALMRSVALQAHLQDTVIENMDFEAFLAAHAPRAGDFIFLDPPYDSEFSTYAKNTFTLKDQERLASYLQSRCQAKFMLVIKNTPAIFDLYGRGNLTIRTFDKKYLVSFQDRNDRDAEHLIITNY